MADNSKQHFVPSSYLKAWCDPETPSGYEPYVWTFDREGGNPKKKAPANIFHETDMYTIKRMNGDRDLVLEQGLSQLEGSFVSIRKDKLANHLPLEIDDHILLCAFVAAAQARTPTSREHHREQWKRPLEIMEDMDRSIKNMTLKQKESFMSRQSMSSASEGRKGLSYEQVKALSEAPLQKMLFPLIQSTAPMLAKIDMAILETDDSTGFITSDNPCVWFDPVGYKRPPMYRGPALMYETIEITLPISPRQMLLLNRHGANGYLQADELMLNEFNRRTRAFCGDSFVVRKNEVNPYWLEQGVEPADSWDATHRNK